MAIKTIQTAYRGYKFRSRLEARWAVFFDAFPLKWEYEIEGYDLGTAGYYLPDFYLPEMSLWIEVKPDRPITQDEKTKIETLAKMTDTDVLLASGTPGPNIYDFFTSWETNEWDWAKACFNQKYLPPMCHDGDPRLFLNPGAEEGADCFVQIEAARSARFEYGETPR